MNFLSHYVFFMNSPRAKIFDFPLSAALTLFNEIFFPRISHSARLLLRKSAIFCFSSPRSGVCARDGGGERACVWKTKAHLQRFALAEAATIRGEG